MRTSILLPVHNQWQLTRLCVGALERSTPAGDWELIVIDNGSTDGVSHWLDQLILPGVPIRLLRNATNLGYAAACNQGLAQATGDGCLLLHTDTVVTDGWLDRLWAPLDRDPAIGLSGPLSNHATPAQLLKPPPYGGNPKALLSFAKALAERNAGKGWYTERLSGFCLLVRRSVLDTIGGLDEQTGLRFGEDLDYCVRAGLAGFRLWVCADAVVHHFGGRTLGEVEPDYQRLLDTNWEIFRAKWGLPRGRVPWDDVAMTAIREAWQEQVPLYQPFAADLAPACVTSEA